MNNEGTIQLNSYVSAKQLAQALGLSKSGFYALYKHGKFPAGVKLGHSRRWNIAKVQSWLEERSKG